MMKGLWKLSWIETKVFLREPLGVIGSLGMPVFVFVFLGKTMGSRAHDLQPSPSPPFNVTILAALIIAISSALSLIAIMSIYREGGILKRLRATPLSPLTILGAHVLVKLVFTIVGLALLVLAGRQFFPGAVRVDLVSFTAALLLSTLSIISLGFILASIVPTARFAQPLGAVVLYPMIAISGLVIPVGNLPFGARIFAFALPTTHAVALMQGISDGSGWGNHLENAAFLVFFFILCSGVASRVFRWE